MSGNGARRRAGGGDTRYLPEAQRAIDKEEDKLLVFGYQCKIFHDDEKATFIDRKKHLIPWMGDNSLLIDRYDGRGHLYDLKPYDADVNKGRHDPLTEEEKRIEALIDEERYLELHTDVAERAMYEEEELKRLNEEVGGSYGAVNFDYDYTTQQDGEEQGEDAAQQQIDEEKEDSEGEEPFEAPDQLKVPYGMEVPTTVKENAIIEKTATFVSKQGAQMEIVIKTKQQNNPSFEFLHYNHAWNPYYKHMVRMIKSGLYKPQEVKRKRLSSGSEDGKYLHPALMRDPQSAIEEQIDSKKFLESVKAKLPSGQITNTLYSKLVSNLVRSSGRDSPIPPNQSGSNGEVNSAPPVDQYDTSGYPAAPTYQSTEEGVYDPSCPTVPPPPGMEPVTLPAGVPLPPGVTQPPPPGTQPPPPGTEPPGPNYSEDQTTESQATYDAHYQDPYYSYYHQQGEHPAHYAQSAGYTSQHTIEQGPQPYHHVPEQQPVAQSQQTAPSQQQTLAPQHQPVAPSQQHTVAPPQRTSLVEYGPDLDPEPEEQQPQSTEVAGPEIVEPPPDILPVIDKMASYVAKNGPAFEFVVKNKADGRFDFVHSWHQHNPYYEYRKKIYSEENEVERKLKEAEDKQRQEEEEAISGSSKAVTFTMKAKKKEKTTLKTKTALLYESSDEDEDSEGGEGRKDRDEETPDTRTSSIAPPVAPAIVPPSVIPAPSGSSLRNVIPAPSGASLRNVHSAPGQLGSLPSLLNSAPAQLSAVPGVPVAVAGFTASSAPNPIGPSPLASLPGAVSATVSRQMSPTPTNIEDNKTAEDKLKDKLAMAARDKLAATNKEKLIQAERKRKAAMFAAMLKSGKQEVTSAASSGGTLSVTSQGEEPTGPTLPLQLPVKGAAIPPPLSLISSSTTPATSRSVSPAVSTALKDSKTSTPGRTTPSRAIRSKSRKSRSRSPRTKRSRSKDRSRRSRSRSNLKSSSRRHKSRSRTRSRSPKKRRKSRSRSKSPRRRKRSKSPTIRSRKSPSRRKRTRSRSNSPVKIKKKKSKRSRSRSHSRRSRSKSKSKSSKHKSPSKKKSKKKKKAKSRSRSRSTSKARLPLNVVPGEETSDDVIEIKSESGGEDAASGAPAGEVGMDDSPAAPTPAPTAPTGADTNNAVDKTLDQNGMKEPSAVSGTESPAPVEPSTTSTVPSSSTPATSALVALRPKTTVDMFDETSRDSMTSLKEIKSGVSSPTPSSTTTASSTAKRNVSSDMLMKVRAMLRASRAAADDS